MTSGFTSNFDNLPPGVSDADIEKQTEPNEFPSVEADGEGYIIRLDDDANWHHLTKEEAKALCSALLTDGPGASKHLLQVTIG